RFTLSGRGSILLHQSQSANELTFIAPDAAGPMKSFVIHNNLPMTTWQLKINDMTSVLDKLWIVIRYALK
ncbi:MAG: hypothetical protein L7F78_27290, partial [Syntrophales bacterium LBB04]|nr:hypothetical protein [Syntrophales bacterium LBB04]